MNTYKKTFKRNLFAFIGVLLIAFVVVLPLSAVSAEEPYYATFEEYKNAGQPSDKWVYIADAMDAVFDKGVEYFEAGNYTEAYDCVNDGYYGYYETTGFERLVLGYVSGARKSEVELQFSACKAVAKNQGDIADFEKEITALKELIRTDAHILDGTSPEGEGDSSADGSTEGSTTTKSAGAAAFTASLSIMIREGLEAIIIVGAIITYLKKSATDSKMRRKNTIPIYVGSVIGIGASFAMAAILESIKLANTASQEIIEGVTALLAVMVLFYVSVWMLSRSEADAWTKYIKSKTEKSTSRGSMFALAFTAFLAVFREGAEVVLFFQPMLSGDNDDSVWAGFIVGSICLVFIYLAVNILSIKLPLKPFFIGTSILMFFMSISFLGAGIKELIEGDVITMVSPEWLQWIPVNDLFDVLGIYPTLQTLIPQLILLVISAVIFVITTKKNNAIHAVAEEKRAEERRIQAEADAKAEKEAFEKEVRRIIKEVMNEKETVTK